MTNAARVRAMTAALCACGAFAVSAAVPEGAVTAENAAKTVLPGGDIVFTFTNGVGKLELRGFAEMRVLAVGGGGAGGSGASGTSSGACGGGGGGGFVELGSSVYAAGTYTATPGAGGAATEAIGSNGADSTLTAGDTEIVRALGGGGGGVRSNGRDGGSGGGGSLGGADDGNGGAALQPAGGFGNAGGASGGFKAAAGGGGGAGGAGQAAVKAGTSGSGGAGRESDISGATVTYGGGGAGGSYGGTIGTPGTGGGGAGGKSATVIATQGTDGLGGGGGGGGKGVTAGARGGSGVVIVRVSAALAGPLEKPKSVSLGYDGTVQRAIEPCDFAYTITGTSSAKDIGTYTYTVTLKSGMSWSDGTTSPQTVTWSITKEQNVFIEHLQMSGWVAGAPVSFPTCRVKFGTPEYYYRSNSSGEDEWTPLKSPAALAALSAGKYWVKAEVPATDAYAQLSETVPFEILYGPVDTFRYRAPITLDGYTGTETLTNFPVLVKLNEADIEFFSPRSVGRNGFRFADQNGLYLPFEIDTWNDTGDSYVWVRVPELAPGGTEISLFWAPREGAAAVPDNDPEEVWSRYLLVLHGNGDLENAAGVNMGVTAPAGGTLVIDELTGGMFPGVLGGGFSKVRKGRGIEYKNPDKNGLFARNGQFAVSGWFNGTDVDGNNVCMSSASGWMGEGSKGFNFAVEYGNDKAEVWIKNTLVDLRPAPTRNSWHYYGFSFDDKAGNAVVIEVDDKSNKGSKEYADAGLDNWSFGAYSGVGSSATFGGMMDELRILNGPATKDWLCAEYRQIGGEPFYHVGATIVDSSYLNRWLREPSIPQTVIHVGDPVFSEAEIDDGEARYGTVKHVVYRHTDGGLVEIAKEDLMPTEEGIYEIVFTVEAGESGGFPYSGMSVTRLFAITQPAPYTDLETAEGRVMLAGDVAAPQVVGGEAYYLTSSASPTFWTHEGVSSNAVGNLLPYENHTFWTMGFASKLWRFENVRIGNTLPVSDTRALFADQVYLPWSEPVLKNSSSTLRPEQVGRREVAHMVMGNTTGAAIYSSCFTNGIGTIYFDAANAWTETWTQDVGPDDIFGTEDDVYTPNCVIAVYIATNCVSDASLPPTDENVREFDREGVEVVDAYGNADWRPVKLEILRRDYPKGAPGDKPFVKLVYDGEGANGVLDGAGTKLNLSIENGGTAENFYRIYIPLDYTGPVRFKIVRESVYPGYAPDADFGQILIDNIIASRPHMSVDFTCWPQVGESEFGLCDESKKGKRTLGWEAAWMTPFPSATDEEIYARAKPVYKTGGKGGVDVESFVAVVFLNYRWRYLDQTTDRTEPVYSWQQVALEPDPVHGFKAREPLNLPKGRVGDVEFYFTSVLTAPYYDYVDYTGSGLGLGGFYTEDAGNMTNRADVATGGRDWFVRLRDGKSDYEAIRLVTLGNGGVTNTVELELVGDHLWRGYYKTLADTPDLLSYRFEALNRQEPGSTVWSETREIWRTMNDAGTLPAEGVLVDGGEESWSTVPNDKLTGYLLFQLDDSTRALTIVHADYQNFNAWNDANRGSVFVGHSTANESKAGASPVAVSWSELFTDWQDMPATNKAWTESFTTDVAQEYPEYTSFSGSMTPNGWTAGPGMWVFGAYRDPETGRAFQMEGQGRGYVQFVDAANSPRGLESVSFRARLGQAINLGDFSYYDGENKAKMTGYTVVARACFDTVTNASFRGNASISLIGNYRSDHGCYEFRVEQVGAKIGAKGDIGLDKQGQALSLYRWNVNKQTGKVSKTLLGCMTNRCDIASTSGHGGNYMALYLSVSNGCVTAGLRKEDKTQKGVAPGDTLTSIFDTGHTWYNIGYWDESGSALTNGTYGCLIANCEGYINQPCVVNAAVPPPAGVKFDKDKFTDFGGSKALAFQDTVGSSTCHYWFDDLEELWYLTPGRMAAYDTGRTSQWGIKAMVPEQTLAISTSVPGKTEWKRIATFTIDSFGEGKQTVVPLYTTENCSVKIEHVGDLSDMRTDVIVDDIELRQWRGNNWSDTAEMPHLIPNWTDERVNAHTNFIFTSAWIKDESLLLSAKRTVPGTPCSIRSPLFDGTYGRGSGLGMFSFSYENAQPNMNLLLQIATNVNYVSIGNVDVIDDNLWTTVTNFSFAAMTPEERAVGTFSTYIGLHGVQGVMRLIVDPTVVENVQTVDDPDRFGEITITGVYCRDEPTLDLSSWWGWNMRTLGPKDTELRMYLPDVTDGLADQGLSCALNNSTSEGTDISDAETYRQHLPFLQTPTFSSNIVGEVSFKARKYDRDDLSQPAQVTLFGSRTGYDDSDWEILKTFIVSNTTYTGYSYKTEPGDSYGAFRLAVTGVEGVNDIHMSNRAPEGYDNPVRVLLDEVLVMEAVRARVAFRNVGAFRSDMTGTAFVSNVPSAEEQPICGESWGVQCEIYAAQLAEEIDFTRSPRVYLYWYAGQTPWGFDNWRTNSSAHCVELISASGTNLVYRSSEASSPSSAIDMATSLQTVQYGLAVVYYNTGYSKPVTNYLSAADWKTPEWYYPVDYNRTLGQNSAFSAYCILDSVAPYWAWFNEVNIMADFDGSRNGDVNNQYIEVAVPQEADITGWSVNILAAHTTSGLVITNEIAKFGTFALPGRKNGNIGAEDGMVFRVLGCPDALADGRLSRADGTLDDVWTITEYAPEFNTDGQIFEYYPVGFQLIRESGIIEHEILVMGTNMWTDPLLPETLRNSHDPAYVAEFLAKKMPGSDFLYVGDDDGGETKSRGVFQQRGRADTDWNRTMDRSPGRKNGDQIINADEIPTPNGSSILVNCYVDDVIGHIYQTVGDAVETNSYVQISLKKGNENGTNITYRVDPWYQLDNVSVKTGKLTTVAAAVETAKRVYEVNVGRGCSNNVTVRATARLQDSLIEGGLTEDNPYTPAVVDWLVKHVDAYGREWANPDADEPILADYISYKKGVVITNLTLTQMYLLDMDPTAGDLALIGGIGTPEPHVMVNESGMTVTNTRVSTYMMMTNRATGAQWTPYVMRAVEPGVTSWDYEKSEADWSSPNMTFKITGIVNNGKTGMEKYEDWLPLRWFVFVEDSFYPPDAGEKAGFSYVEVDDPHSSESPGYWEGWKDWPDCPYFYRWGIDSRLKPHTVEILHRENLYTEKEHE